MKMQTALRLLYPSQCLTCANPVEGDASLCGGCWRETPFIYGLTCRSCGVPLPGDDDGQDVQCDDCLTIARPWHRGAAAMLYKGNGRSIALRLKHGDRTDFAVPASAWMAKAAPRMPADGVVVPVPLHWLRLLRRRYNQSALLAKRIATRLDLTYLPDSLHRFRATDVLDGKTRDLRFAAMDQAIVPHPKRGGALAGKAVLLVDDVMTSGATLAACAEACVSEGARSVDMVVLARVAKDD
ncbi:putative amidophosphoribosyltransferase [Litoreibacter ponti]|uniref:Putative amidophosphoribosyltransferase n=1 Tax=Litoreibacter ponti TaxID=1510457 RepID=A0A2T6BNX6_9RHOB|nr:double zinc ribbon domain-containing protein [Litoreibacter ponti]PTX57779.1 putative amidophosphoribosyltransferase [Litoreibacter ponti]